MVSSIHFGAIARHLAVDAAATLTHDVEKAWQDSKILTALAFDLKEHLTLLWKKTYSSSLATKHPAPNYKMGGILFE